MLPPCSADDAAHDPRDRGRCRDAWTSSTWQDSFSRSLAGMPGPSSATNTRTKLFAGIELRLDNDLAAPLHGFDGVVRPG
jgi:hypothetical protein